MHWIVQFYSYHPSTLAICPCNSGLKGFALSGICLSLAEVKTPGEPNFQRSSLFVNVPIQRYYRSARSDVELEGSLDLVQVVRSMAFEGKALLAVTWCCATESG